MKTLKQVNQEIEKLLKIKKELEEQKKNTKWIKISNEHICSVNSINGKCIYEISTEQLHNNKTYAEITSLLKDNEQIADYPLLHKLRNSGEFDFLKDFLVFVPNPDKISKKNNYVARFDANSYRANLYCDRSPTYSYPSLGVFIVRRVK
jgi:hypothetical protein